MGYSDMSVSPASDANGQVVVLLLADISHASRLWGWSRIVKGPQALQGIPGLLFQKYWAVVMRAAWTSSQPFAPRHVWLV
jgi:hypothetical protein